MEEIRKYIPLFQSDYEFLESYLEYQATRGCFLQSLGFLSGKFIKGDPSARKYRVIPEAWYVIDEEEKAFYDEAGWHAVKTVGSWSVLYSDGNDATELFTDESSFKYRTRWYVRTLVANLVLYIFLLWSIGSNIVENTGSGSNTPYDMMLYCIERKPYAAIALALLTTVIVYTLGKRLAVRSNAGTRSNHNMNSVRKIFFLNSFSIVLVVASVVLMFVQGE